MLSSGTQVGNYVIEEEIGCGGMARLYRVRHAVLQTRHALKVLEPTYRQNAELRTRFLNEALIGARISHPSIVRVTDVVSTPEVAGIVMELVTGPNLDTYLRGLRSPPPAATVRALFAPVLAAVGAAHQQGIVHRDLKPANILLQQTDGGFLPKVTDFGIAKVTEAARELVGKKGSTHADTRMGTLAYMSPEQIRHAKEVTIRSDVFSLGATLYELVTLRVAFEGESDYDVMHRIVEGRYFPLEQIPGVDPSLAAAIHKALQPDPERRFASCEEFLRALSAPVAPQAPLAAPAPRPPPAVSPVATAPGPSFVPPARTKSRALVKLAGLLGVPAAVLLLYLARHAAQDRAERPPPRQLAPSAPAATVAPVPRSVRETWTGPTPFSGCIKSRVAKRIAVTYLTPDRGLTDADELRSWFAKLPAAMIDVFLLERKNGTRLVSFEISRDKWPLWWNLIVGSATGEEVCWLLGKALVEGDVGRPLAQRLNGSQTAYEYDIFDVRNPAKYPQDLSLGDLQYALSPEGLAQIQAWLTSTDSEPAAE